MEDPSFRDRVEPLDQEESGRSLNVNPFITSAAGALSGLLVDGIVHPLDTVRARIQTGALLITKTKATSISPSVLCSNNRTPTVLHCRNTLHAIISIIKLEGPRSLFNGFSSVALLSAPAHAIYFTIYEKTKALDLGSPFDSTAITNLSAGFAAEAAGALLWTPMDVIKQRMQIISRSTTQQHTTRASLSSTVGSIVELNGYTVWTAPFIFSNFLDLTDRLIDWSIDRSMDDISQNTNKRGCLGDIGSDWPSTALWFPSTFQSMSISSWNQQLS